MNGRRPPIAERADGVLVTAAVVGPLEGGALTGKIAQWVAVDLLIATLGVVMKDAAARTRLRTAEACWTASPNR